MTRVKICGVTRLEDAERAIDLGTWAIGLNYWSQSPRFCDPDDAAAIGTAVKRRCEVAGVFVNPTLGEVATAVEDASLTLVQLHGDEGPSFCSEVARRTGAKVIKAMRVKSGDEVRAAEAYRTDFHLFDAHRSGKPGGTGESFDWGLIAERRSKIPLILAGGLDPGNVADAIGIASPYAVDVATGVESEPGIKDPALFAALFAAVAATDPAKVG
ncbi:MAG: phosphoribosylanthranilate isomerase [Solirubrobacterales bacterium]|nr:phosphoribosylanthranilate isomerase [Solirubrobacterales bacterium]